MEAYTGTGATKSNEKMDKFFQMFDRKKKGFLDFSDFHDMLSQLLSYDNKPYPLDSQLQRDLFTASDIDGDGKVSKKEFQLSWKSWIADILDPISALLIIDVQNDFITGNLALKNCPAKQDGAEVVDVINRLLNDVKFDVVVYTLDFHPPDHISFYENVRKRKLHPTSKIKADRAMLYDEVIFDTLPQPRPQVLWPAHCVQKSYGAQLHERLQIIDGHIIVKKGRSPDVDSYSAFWDNGKLSQTNLHEQLKAKRVSDVYVCGLAYDYCVAHTAQHAAEFGYRTVLIEDASRAVTIEGMNAAKHTLAKQDVLFVQADEVSDLVRAKNRPSVLGRVSYRRLLQQSGKEGSG